MKRYLIVLALAVTGCLSAATIQCSGLPDVVIEGLDGTYVCEGCLPDVVVITGYHHNAD